MDPIVYIIGGIVFVAAIFVIFRMFIWDLFVEFKMPVKGAILLGPFVILYFLPGGGYDTLFGNIWDATRIFEGSRHAQLRGREGRHRDIGRLIDSLTSAETGQAKKPEDIERVQLLRQMWWDLGRNRRYTYGDQMRVLVCRDELNLIWFLFQYGNLASITDLANTSASLPPEWHINLGGRYAQKLIVGGFDPIPESETQFWQPYADFKVEDARFAFFYPYKRGQMFGAGASVIPPSPVTAKAMLSSAKSQRLADLAPIQEAEVKIAHRMREEYLGKSMTQTLREQVLRLAMPELGIGEGRLPLFSGGGNLGLRQALIVGIGAIAGMAAGTAISPGQVPIMFFLALLGIIIGIVIATSSKVSSGHI